MLAIYCTIHWQAGCVRYVQSASPPWGGHHLTHLLHWWRGWKTLRVGIDAWQISSSALKMKEDVYTTQRLCCVHVFLHLCFQCAVAYLPWILHWCFSFSSFCLLICSMNRQISQTCTRSTMQMPVHQKAPKFTCTNVVGTASQSILWYCTRDEPDRKPVAFVSAH